ncbi:MAG TPA: hypothetical protein VNL74_13785, partial [Methylococcus sp.]|nr:hypothetical protein [Methylococcus sp.]
WPDFTLFTASSLNSAVYSCFGIFIAFLSSVIVILRHHWKTIFRGKVSFGVTVEVVERVTWVFRRIAEEEKSLGTTLNHVNCVGTLRPRFCRRLLNS